MKRAGLTLLALAVIALIAAPANAAPKPEKPDPPRGANHYTMHIIGKAQCDQADGDCWDAQECVDGIGPGATCSNGHTLFVPLTTIETDVCDAGSSLDPEPEWADLIKGVRILVTDGEDFTIPDRDGTDGKARFTIPAGCYDVWARAHGKPNGCMELNSILCYDCVEGPLGDQSVCGDPGDTDDTYEQVDCDENGGNDKWVREGFLDVSRNKGERQHWQNATDELLGASSILTKYDNNINGYFDFLWVLYNNYLRNLELRIVETTCN